jgi:probable HAF family extracellular repeat protein
MLTYTITELPPPAGGNSDAFAAAEDVNADGVAAGSAAFRGPGLPVEALIWSENASPTVLDSPPPNTLARAINDAGDAVGYRLNLPVRPFIYRHETGQVEHFSAHIRAPQSWAVDVNNDGLVTGSCGDATPWVPFLYDGNNGSVILLEPFPGRRTLAAAINEAGHVAGFSATEDLPSHPRAFIYRDEVMQDLGPAGDVTDVNNNDVLVGTAWESVPFRAFRLDASVPNPSVELITASQMPGHTQGFAINDEGVVVGTAWHPDGRRYGFVDIPSGVDTGFHDLQDVVVEADGWVLEDAFGISNTGYIVGIGTHRGEYRGYLLTPAPDYRLKKEIVKVREVLLGLLGIYGGATVGGSGWGLLPGGKPVPIPPHSPAWERWEALTVAERDFYLGLAIQHLDSIVAGGKRREIIQQAGRQIVESAMKELER